MTSKNTLCLRMTKEERKAISKNFGRYIEETGELISLTDFIIMKFSEKLNVDFKKEDRKFVEPRMQFQMNIPPELHDLIAAEAAANGRSINKLVISEIT